MKREINPNIRKNGKITAIIPVRDGSVRCKHKNFRDFGDTNLLERKINQLKKVKDIHEIIVSTGSKHMLKIAKKCGVKAIKRHEYYTRSTTTPNEVFRILAQTVKTPIMLYVHCVAPFSKNEDLIQMIQIFRNNITHTSVVSAEKIKKHLWENETPINFNLENMAKTQDLPDICTPTYAFNIIETELARKSETIFGKKPYFYQTNQINSIDIDTPLDFVISELLYKNNIETEEDINEYLNKTNQIELLDCTIRDGGYTNKWQFTDKEVLECYKAVSQAGYDYFEIGFKTNRNLISEKDNGKWLFCDEKDINNIVEQYKEGCKIAVLTKINEIKVNDFLPKSQSKIDLIRLYIPNKALIENKYESIITQELLDKHFIFIEHIISLGYEISLNFGNSDNIKDNEIDMICKTFKPLYNRIKCIYMVDTYGAFTDISIKNIIYKFKKYMRKNNINIPFGFHAHDNCKDSISKTLAAINVGTFIIDSCIGGLGRGAGNTPSELLIPTLNKNKYKIEPIYKFLDRFNYKVKYNTLYAYSAKINCHPNYVTYLMNNQISLLKSYHILNKIQKYSKEYNQYFYLEWLIKSLL
jgi:4-hydroxy 2-oxovalerate aldolase